MLAPACAVTHARLSSIETIASQPLMSITVPAPLWAASP